MKKHEMATDGDFMSESALRLIMESVWAVSARRAFDAGFRAGRAAGAEALDYPTAEIVHAEAIENSAPVLVADEIVRRARVQAQALYDRASPDTGHGRAQRYALGLVLDALRASA